MELFEQFTRETKNHMKKNITKRLIDIHGQIFQAEK